MVPQISQTLQRLTMGKKNVLVRNKKNRAIQLFQSQQLPEATALLEAISKRDRTDFEVLCMLGSCYSRTGRLGLWWDDACLEFHKSKRLVTTASQDQVKQPLYRKSNNKNSVRIPHLFYSQQAVEACPDSAEAMVGLI